MLKRILPFFVNANFMRSLLALHPNHRYRLSHTFNAL
jgi:hypothetical protein